MKHLLLLTLLFSQIVNAQLKNSYVSLRGGVAMKDDNTKGIGHLSVGYSHNDIVGIGAGIGFAQFDKTYIPLTVDLSFFGKPDKISPVVIGSAGYGLYKYDTEFFTVKGGFTGSLNAGISFPVKNTMRLFLTGGYAIYSFNGGENIATPGMSFTSESNVKMFTITGGIKF